MTSLKHEDNLIIQPEVFEVPSGSQDETKFKLTKGHWLLLAIASLISLFILFISVAKSIQVVVKTPDLTNKDLLVSVDASYTLSSYLKLPIANRVLVLPGQHEVTVEAQGYKTESLAIDVADERQQEFVLTIKPLPGSLQVSIEPDVEAKITVDGVLLGTVPGTIEGVEAGTREIVIDAPLYRSDTQQLTIEGQERVQSLAVSLEPAWGELSVLSSPANAQVLLNGEVIGDTPLTVKVEEGAHELLVKADKFKPAERSFTISAGEQIQVKPIELVPADGVIKVSSTPPEAAVIIGGVYQGLSPIEVTVRPDADQQVQIYKAGFRLHQSTLKLAPAQAIDHEISLAQDQVSVQFSISPPSATLYVDDKKVVPENGIVRMDTLPHRISVRKSGYVTYNNVIIPTKTSQQVVSIKLLTKEQEFWAKLPANYQTVAGQQMKLFKSPGVAIMGSTRRETGRRSNEVSYKADLTKHFYVSLHEVTNKQFRQFRPTHSSGNYKGKSLDANRHPAVNLSWQYAALYCNWLSDREGLDKFYQTKSGFVSGLNESANGYRLLTEAEWAWLARNQNGSVITFPWGNASRPPANSRVGNFADQKAAEFIAFTINGYDDGYKASAPIGRFPPNHRGLYDMGGNAAEWVNDWYSALSDLESDSDVTLVDPLGPEEGEFHVIRGASWARGHLPQVRLAYRDFGAKGKYEVGFRIARYVGTPK